jgi:hypothetical protein
MKQRFILAILKNLIFLYNFCGNVELYSCLYFIYVLENLALFYRDFGMNLYSIKNNEAMKRCSEAMKR